MGRRIGIIVDGEGDYASFKRRFTQNFKILKTDGPRGSTVELRDIVSKSKKQVSMLNAFGCTRIIIVIDYEVRNVSYTKFVSLLENEFRLFEWGRTVSIAVPNRMIENWYLADIAFLSKKKSFLRDNIKQKRYDGIDGKSKLKGFFIKKINYIETKHGPQLFAVLRFNVARGNSPSFDHFLRVLQRP